MWRYAPRKPNAELILKKSDFDFELPPELIAQAPLAERSASRMLMLDVPAATQQDRMFRELPDILRPGDLLVFNDTRVLPARLYGRKNTGGAVEILIERVTGAHSVVMKASFACVSRRLNRSRNCYSSWAKCRCRLISSGKPTPAM
jgi:S-adenosylmethionine:tRNA-ribosyltransferase-isomerase (queuine synthetase)